jgi:hypothetical protein
LNRLKQAAVCELENTSVDTLDQFEADCKIGEILSLYYPKLPQLDVASTWLDYLEIKFTANPRIQLEFSVLLDDHSVFTMNYQASGELDVPVSFRGSWLVFTYNVDCDFDPEETKKLFRSDLESVRQLLQGLEAEAAIWSDRLRAELAARIRRRRSPIESLSAKIDALGYPTMDPRKVAGPSNPPFPGHDCAGQAG